MTVTEYDGSTEIVGLDPTGGRLMAWANAARAAHDLASMLVRTTIIPESFRVTPAMSPVEADRVTGNCAAALLLGDELGLTPMAALRAVYVVRGVTGFYARAMVALAKSHGHAIWTESETDDAVTVCGHRRDDPDHVERVTWTIARARGAGLIRRGRSGEPSQYELQPRTMLYARAAADVARRVAPDVLLGVPELTADEIDATPRAASGTTTTVQRRPRVTDPDPSPDRGLPGPGAGSVAGDATPVNAESATGDMGFIPPGEAPDELPPPTHDTAGESADEPPNDDAEPTITKAQLTRVQVMFVQAGVRGADARHVWLSRFLGRPIESTSDITVTEASAVMDALEIDDTDRRDLR